MKTILITGGAGFIGSHIAEKLRLSGDRIILVDNFNDFYPYPQKIRNVEIAAGIAPSDPIAFEKSFAITDLIKRLATEENAVKLYDCDIRETAKLKLIIQKEQPACIIHLAALAGVRPSIQDPQSYIDVNINGTQSVLDAAKDCGIRNIIAASSSSVYGNTKTLPFNEDMDVSMPISPYAATKKCNEVLGHAYHHLFQMNLLFLRFFTVYGPRQRPDLAIRLFTERILSGKEIPFYGDGSTYRDYTFISDIVTGILQSIEYITQIPSTESVYEIINLGAGRKTTLSDMLHYIENNISKKANLLPLPKQDGDMEATWADITKAKKLIGYQPEIHFKEGITYFIEWFLAQNRPTMGKNDN